MKLQSERLEKNTARLIVEVEDKELDRAKKSAATKLSTRYKIPGFRKGKAPYNIVVKFLGEGAILEEAVEVLADEIYPKALTESGLRPYANGTLENFTLEPQPTYTFTLPLQAEVNLGDYQAVRVVYAQPSINEDALERTMEALRQQEGKTTPVEGDIEVGHRITVDLHSHFVDGEEREAHEHDHDEEHDHEHDHDEEHDHEHDHDEEHDHEHDDNVTPLEGDEFLHRHDAAVNLNRDNEPFLPGFIDQVVGKKAGDVIEFDLVVPSDTTDFANIAGRTVHFEVDIKKVQSVELPELDDAFAQRLTEKEENPLNLEQLRARVMENLQNEAAAEYESNYSDNVLDQIIAIAQVTFPELMVDNRVQEMVEDFKSRLKQQNITFDVYKSVTGITEEKIAEQYRADAEKFVTRSLVLGEILVKEKVIISNADMEKELNLMVEQYGNSPQMKTFFNSKEQRESIANRLVYAKLMDHITLIGKGEATQVLTEGTESAAVAADND